MSKTGIVLIAVLGVVAALLVAGVVALTSVDVNDYRDRIAEEVEKATGRRFAIEQRLDLRLSLTPSVAVGDLRLANASWGSRPDMAVLKRAEVEVELLPLIFGDLRVKRLVIDGLDLLLETDSEGRGNWELGPRGVGATEEPATGAGAVPSVAEVAISDILITWRDGKTGESLPIKLRRLVARAENADAPLSFEFAASYRAQDIEGAGELGPLSRLAAGDQPYPVRLVLDAAGAKVTLDGTIERPMEGAGLALELGVEGGDLSSLSALVGAALPSGGYSLKTRISGSPERIELNGLRARLGASDVAGEVKVALAGARPRIEARLASSLVDLDDFAVPGGADTAPAKPTEGGEAKAKRIFSDEPLPLGALSSLDADVELAVDRMKAGQATLEKLTVKAVLEDGKLTVRPLDARLADGEIKGELGVDGNGGAAGVGVDLSVAGLDVGALLKQMEAGEDFVGKADFKMRLRGRGASMRALMAGLNGRLSLEMGEGRFRNQYLGLLSADMLGSIAPWTKKKDYTVVKCVVARFEIVDGKAASRGILFDTETMTVAGEGGVDLGDETLALTLTPRPKETSLMNYAVPLKIGGTLAKPSVGPDKAAVAKRAAGAALSLVNPLVALVPLVTGTMGSEDNPCVAALSGGGAGDRAGKRAAPAAAKAPRPASPPRKEGGLKGLLKGLGGKIDETIGGGDR